MPRLYPDPIVEENPITGQEVTKVRFEFVGNNLNMMVSVEQGFLKEGETNNVGLPLWKVPKGATQDQRSRTIGDAAFGDMCDAHWDILTTAGTPKVRRLVLFLQALGWEVVDVTEPSPF